MLIWYSRDKFLISEVFLNRSDVNLTVAAESSAIPKAVASWLLMSRLILRPNFLVNVGHQKARLDCECGFQEFPNGFFLIPRAAKRMSLRRESAKLPMGICFFSTVLSINRLSASTPSSGQQQAASDPAALCRYLRNGCANPQTRVGSISESGRAR